MPVFEKVTTTNYILSTEVAEEALHAAQEYTNSVLTSSKTNMSMVNDLVKNMLAYKVSQLVSEHLESELVLNGFILIRVPVLDGFDVTVGIVECEICFAVAHR